MFLNLIVLMKSCLRILIFLEIFYALSIENVLGINEILAPISANYHEISLLKERLKNNSQPEDQREAAYLLQYKEPQFVANDPMALSFLLANFDNPRRAWEIPPILIIRIMPLTNTSTFKRLLDQLIDVITLQKNQKPQFFLKGMSPEIVVPKYTWQVIEQVARHLGQLGVRASKAIPALESLRQYIEQLLQEEWTTNTERGFLENLNESIISTIDLITPETPFKPDRIRKGLSELSA